MNYISLNDFSKGQILEVLRCVSDIKGGTLDTKDFCGETTDDILAGLNIMAACEMPDGLYLYHVTGQELPDFIKNISLLPLYKTSVPAVSRLDAVFDAAGDRRYDAVILQAATEGLPRYVALEMERRNLLRRQESYGYELPPIVLSHGDGSNQDVFSAFIDLMSLQEKLGRIDNLSVAVVGMPDNRMNSLLSAAGVLGWTLHMSHFAGESRIKSGLNDHGSDLEAALADADAAYLGVKDLALGTRFSEILDGKATRPYVFRTNMYHPNTSAIGHLLTAMLGLSLGRIHTDHDFFCNGAKSKARIVELDFTPSPRSRNYALPSGYIEGSGIVIDHIPTDYTRILEEALELETRKFPLVYASNMHGGQRLSAKGIIKIHQEYEFSDNELTTIALFAPGATISIIRESKIVRKFRYVLGSHLEGRITCVNDSCISNRYPVAPLHTLLNGNTMCVYCETPERLTTIFEQKRYR